MKNSKEYKYIIITIYFTFLISGCNSVTNVNNKPDVQKETASEYIIGIEKNLKNLSPNAQRERDSIYTLYTKLPLYKTLFIDKVVDIKYLPIVGGIGFAIISQYDNDGYIIPVSLYDYVSALKESDTLLLQATLFATRGGYIPEFEDVVKRYVNKFGYTGKKGDALIKNDETSVLPLNNNLVYAMLLIAPHSHIVLDALGESVKVKGNNWLDKSFKEIHHYENPQYLFKNDYIAYLKANYPNSKYIPNYEYELTAAQLNAFYHENEVVADNKLKGKRVAITGKIMSIAKNAFDEPYILLDAGEFLSDVHCAISENDAMQLHKYQKVTVVGNCEGMTMQSVFIDKCEIQ